MTLLSRRNAAAVLAVIIAILVLTPLLIWTSVLSGDKVSQTETFQLYYSDLSGKKVYLPMDAVVTVTAPRIMHVAEGFDKVDVKIDLVNRGNISSFNMSIVMCYLGNWLNNDRADISAFDFREPDALGENGTSYRATFFLDPHESVSDVRIWIAMSINIFYNDGSSIGLGGFNTAPIFGLYDVQNRLPILAALALCGAVIAVVTYHVLAKDRTGRI